MKEGQARTTPSGPASDPPLEQRKKLLFIASGSYEKSILKRNAQDRFRDLSLDGYFDRVDYFFFPSDISAEHWVPPSHHVYEIGASEGKRGQRKQRIKRFLAAFRQIASHARKEPPALIGAGEPFLSALLAWGTGRLVRRPFYVVVVSAYELSRRGAGVKFLEFFPGWLVAALEKFMLKRADLVITDTHFYRDYSLSRGAPSSRVQVVPRHADRSVYKHEADPTVWERLGVDDQSPLLYVGRLSPEKHVLDLMAVLEQATRVIPTKQLVILGDGPERKELERQARGLGLEDQVIIRSGEPSSEIYSSMAHAGAVLVTHGGYSLLEAALMAAPIVAYNYEWHPEIIVNNETGLLVPFRDTTAMAEAALRLLDDHASAQAMGKTAQSKVSRAHSPERAIAAHIDCFEKLLSTAR